MILSRKSYAFTSCTERGSSIVNSLKNGASKVRLHAGNFLKLGKSKLRLR